MPKTKDLNDLSKPRKPATRRAGGSSPVPDELKQEIKAQVVKWLASGKFLTEYCRQDTTVTRETLYDWMDADVNFASHVAQARARGEEVLFEGGMEIVDEKPPLDVNGRLDPGYVAWQKNRVWTRLQMLAKINPKKYGDKIDLNHGGEVTVNQWVTLVPHEPGKQDG